MLFDSQQFDRHLIAPVSWSDNVFRYCDFAQLDTEGGDVDSVFISCTFEKCDWYWGLFNLAVFVQVKFVNCKFRGSAFSGSRFIECDFSNCEFTIDNLNSGCSFEDTAWYGCTQNNCTGLEHEFRNVL